MYTVDSQFNVKIADLELGIASRLNNSINEGSGVGIGGENDEELNGEYIVTSGILS